MKIAFDAKRAAQNRTGLGNYSRFVIENLSHYYDKNEYMLYIPQPNRTPFLGKLKETANCSLHYPSGRFWRKLPSLWRLQGITHQLREDKPVLFHGLSNELPVGIERLHPLKTIVTIHDLIFLRYPHFYRPIDRCIYTKKFKSACKRSDSIVAVSECTKRDLIHFYGIDPDKIKVIYQGCDESFRAPVSLENQLKVRQKYQLPDHYLLYVGSIESRKNLMRIVEAMAHTQHKLPLVAVGKHTPYADKVKQRAEELGISNQLILIHDAKFMDFPAIYQMASLFIYPSYFEGFGIPLLEALCSSVPVIGATGSCLEEAGGPDSLYINPDDADELAHSIDRVLGDEGLQKQMIQKGLTYSKRFMAEPLAAEMMAHYHAILSQP